MGLLETIAALTIMAASAAVLFPWVSQSLRALERSKESEERTIAMLQSLRWVEGIDPALEPSGVQRFDGYRVKWNFNPMGSEPTRITNSGGQFRSFTSQLYDGDVTVERSPNLVWFRYTHRLISYKRLPQSVVMP